MVMDVNRREFMSAVAAGASILAVGSRSHGAEVAPKSDGDTNWFDVADWGVEGRGWSDVARFYDRLPSRAEKLVRPAVWNLSRHSAGMLTQFKTDSATIRVRYRLLSSNIAMPHMPATGVSGVDLYARTEAGEDRWLAVSRPSSQTVEATLVGDIDPLSSGQARLFTMYLPLYNGVESLEIGVDANANFTAVKPRDDKPLVFYGTSIMQGACASRTGMSITGIVGRRLDRPVINLGFSGNGRMEIEVARLLAELDPCVYCIDCLPNIKAPDVASRTEPLVHLLREARPDTPILLVEDRSYTYAPFRKSARSRHAASRAALRKAFDKLNSSGIKHLHYLAGANLLGSDGEAATDGSHPNDLGMVRYADAYESILQDIL